MSDAAKTAARKAESSSAFRILARAGFAANGVVHILIGVIVLAIALGAKGQSDQSGAFEAIASAPLGFVALWLLAIAMWALALWHLAEGLLAGTGDDTAKKWGRRVSEWGQAVVFIALGAIAASVALGSHPSGNSSTKNASRGVLSIPGGPWVLGLVGLAIGIGGVSFAVMGLMRSFRKKMTIPRDGLGTAVTTLGVVGYVAKGVALAIVGILLLVAAVKVDPNAAGGLDGAIATLLHVAYGRWLAGIVGLGFVAYGVFCLFRARYADL